MSGFARMAMAGVVVLALFAPAHASDPVADRASLSGDTNLTRFVADFSAEVDFEVFALGEPYRVVVDLPDVKFRLPDSLGDKGRGLVKAFRYGVFAPGKSRIVIDVTGPVLIHAAGLQRRGEGEAVRFVLDLIPTDTATFQRALAERRERVRREAALRPPKPIEVTPGQAARQAGKTVIVVDAGHGGIDTGAKSRSGTKEKVILLAVARLVRSELEKRSDYKVVMTRNSDVFVPLRRRVQIAHENEASLFISLHADSLPRRYAQRVRGATVYTLSKKGSDALARAFARRENQSDVFAGIEVEQEVSDQPIVANILFDLGRSAKKALSKDLAKTLLGKLKGSASLNRRPHRSAAFRVLKSPKVPSVLVELGYITNKKDERDLLSKAWRKRVAKRIALAVDTYLKTLKRNGVPY